MENKFETSEWELINPKNIHFSLNNHDGLLWELMIGIKTADGYIRGMPIGFIEQATPEQIEDCYSMPSPRFKFVSNKKDEEYSYRMVMSGKAIMFFRKKREGRD